MGYKFIVFDFDGTLCDTAIDVVLSRNWVYKQFGFKEIDREVAIKQTYMKEGEFVKAGLPQDILADESFVEKMILAYRDRYFNHYMDASFPFEKIPECVGNLKTNGKALAILSNKEEWILGPFAQKLFPDIFSFVRGNIIGEITKPDKRLTYIVLEKIGADLNELSNCVYVGDSCIDIQTAKNAGIDSIAVTWGYTDEEKLRECNPTYIVSSPSELYEIITK